MGRIPPPGEKFSSQRKCHPLHPREELGALVLVAMLVLEAKRVLSSTSVPVADFICEGAEVLEDMSGHAYMLVLAGNASLVLVVERFSPSNSWRTSWKRNMVSTGDPGHYSSGWDVSSSTRDDTDGRSVYSSDLKEQFIRSSFNLSSLIFLDLRLKPEQTLHSMGCGTL